MKKIIDGYLYDTENATKLHNYWNGLSSSDFRNYEESLYLTSNGRFFLSGEGGPMTKWAKSDGNTSTGSSGIIPLTNELALEWAETHEMDIYITNSHFKIKEA